MDADQLVSDRLDQKGCDDGRVNASGEGEQHFVAPHLLPHGSDLLIDKCLG